MDPVSFGLLSIAGGLLGSLNRAHPKDDFEAVKIIDKNDPIRRSLEAMKKSMPERAELFLSDGSTFRLYEILEIGYGAALVRIGWRVDEEVRQIPVPTKTRMTQAVLKKAVATIRYSAVAAIRQEE